MKSTKHTIRQVSHTSKSHQAHTHKECHTIKEESIFDSFAKHFFELFSEKDKKESQIYLDMKSIDASKEHKHV